MRRTSNAVSAPTTFPAVGMSWLALLLYLAVGVGMSWAAGRPLFIHGAGVIPSAVILALTILAFCGIGIIVASAVIYLKKGESINSFVLSASALLGGVFYPTETMPAWLGSLSSFLPITYALRGIRRALLSGATLGDLIPEIRVLFLFVAFLVPLGLLVFRWALRGARRDGTLVQY